MVKSNLIPIRDLKKGDFVKFDDVVYRFSHLYYVGPDNADYEYISLCMYAVFCELKDENNRHYMYFKIDEQVEVVDSAIVKVLYSKN